jgi:hypothetical protein
LRAEDLVVLNLIFQVQAVVAVLEDCFKDKHPLLKVQQFM